MHFDGIENYERRVIPQLVLILLLFLSRQKQSLHVIMSYHALERICKGRDSMGWSLVPGEELPRSGDDLPDAGATGELLYIALGKPLFAIRLKTNFPSPKLWILHIHSLCTPIQYSSSPCLLERPVPHFHPKKMILLKPQ
jgi:hypothetical protein